MGDGVGLDSLDPSNGFCIDGPFVECSNLEQGRALSGHLLHSDERSEVFHLNEHV